MLEENPTALAPLDAALNTAILQICARHVPTFTVSDAAPSTYPDLKAQLDAGQDLVVAAEGSDRTIFGDRAVNFAFRAWHDWCHWEGGFDFSLAGERATCHRQINQLSNDYGLNKRTQRWAELLAAEVVGQRQYYERYRAYIVNQRGFAGAYIVNQDAALSRRW